MADDNNSNSNSNSNRDPTNNLLIPGESSVPTTAGTEDYESLDLSFDDVAELVDEVADDEHGDSNHNEEKHNDNDDEDPRPTTVIQRLMSSSTSTSSSNNNNNNNMDDDDIDEAKAAFKKPPSDYILGTLIVRVVAARDLEPVGNNNAGLNLFFGNVTVPGQGQGSANPYASVRFGATTQRTSEVFGSVNPTWPRGEAMFMDVVHPTMESSSSFADNNEKTVQEKQENSSEPAQQQQSDPGDPPVKNVSDAPSVSSNANSESSSSSHESSEDVQCCCPRRPPEPILTVAVFHASEMGKLHKYNPSKKNKDKQQHLSGDSDDVFLGMTLVNLTELLTGKIRTFDEWLPLQGGGASTSTTTATPYSSSSRSGGASIRIVCEYEASDAPPRQGDLVRFSGFCHPSDLYPVPVDGLFTVEEDCNSSSGSSSGCNDNVLLSYTSAEGWVSTFLAHRFMLICEERHQPAIEAYQDELVSIAQRISHSPIVNVVQESVRRVPDEGLLSVGANAIQGGASLLSRWLEGGVETAVGDLAYATNWDGRLNPDPLSTEPLDEETSDDTTTTPDVKTDSLESEGEVSSKDGSSTSNAAPLPNMPACPITGEPMRNPVVAADGHTYERSAIAKWLKTSDKSPLTGSVLPHKNLVPNYMLLSSLQEAAVHEEASSSLSTGQDAAAAAANEHDIDDDEDETTEVINID